MFVPFRKTDPQCLTIPAGTEIVTFISTHETTPCVILGEQPIPNVFIANTLAIPKNGRIPVRIMNVLNYSVNLKKNSPQVRNSNDYEIYELGPTPQYDENRIKILLSELNLNHLNESDREIIT